MAIPVGKLQISLGTSVGTLTPLLTGLYFGQYVLKLNPLLLLGHRAADAVIESGITPVRPANRSV